MAFELNKWYRVTSAAGEVSYAFYYFSQYAETEGFGWSAHEGGGFVPATDIRSDSVIEPAVMLLQTDHDKLRHDFAQLVSASAGLLEQLRQYTQDATSDTVVVQNILNRRTAALSDNGMVV